VGRRRGRCRYRDVEEWLRSGLAGIIGKRLWICQERFTIHRR
jgi:hypothetical protein